MMKIALSLYVFCRGRGAMGLCIDVVVVSPYVECHGIRQDTPSSTFGSGTDLCLARTRLEDIYHYL